MVEDEQAERAREVDALRERLLPRKVFEDGRPVLAALSRADQLKLRRRLLDRLLAWLRAEASR